MQGKFCAQAANAIITHFAQKYKLFTIYFVQNITSGSVIRRAYDFLQKGPLLFCVVGSFGRKVGELPLLSPVGYGIV